jgi:hypothetical protein
MTLCPESNDYGQGQESVLFWSTWNKRSSLFCLFCQRRRKKEFITMISLQNSISKFCFHFKPQMEKLDSLSNVRLGTT